MNHFLRFFVYALVATLVGCGLGKKANYTNVKGTVTFNGKPLDKGVITFAVIGKPPTFTDITDGKFSGQALVGSNTISVSSKKKTGVAPVLPKAAQQQIKAYREKGLAQGGADPKANFDSTTIELIPAEWGADSKQMRVVEAGAANDFDFNITTKK